jgi:formylglycine-generating enzyme required for sulfatase activity
MIRPRVFELGSSLALFACFLGLSSLAFASASVSIPKGSYPSFSKQKTKGEIKVASFKLDSEPVTKREFLNFVKEHPEWRKSKVKKASADEHYLQNWKSDLNYGRGSGKSPVTFVSWFAAKAFCQAKGESLPTTDQWEYAAFERGKKKTETTQKILEWYGKPNPDILPAVGKSAPNAFGVHDLFGLIWEWTLDFDRAFVIQNNDGFVCGGAGQAVADPSDYATFMRYSFRSSLKANYSIANLGFRCAKSAQSRSP